MIILYLKKLGASINTENFQLIQNMKEVQNALIEKNKILADLVDELQHKLQLYENRNTYYSSPQQEYVRQEYARQDYSRQDYAHYEPEYEYYDRPVRREKNHVFKNFISFLLTIFIISVTFVALWYIPFTHNFFVNLYENNEIIKYIVDLLF